MIEVIRHDPFCCLTRGNKPPCDCGATVEERYTRTPVLIKVHPDGTLEVYGDRKQVDLQIIDVPSVESLNLQHDGSRIHAEKLIERTVDIETRMNHRALPYLRHHLPVHCMLVRRGLSFVKQAVRSHSGALMDHCREVASRVW